LAPPLIEESLPLAVLCSPPLTEDKEPLAVFCAPPLTEDKEPLAVTLYVILMTYTPSSPSPAPR
jgi:hypothetical protein